MNTALDPDWKMDPDLELWVDIKDDVATVRLVGSLDVRTGVSIPRLIDELLMEGNRSFRMDVEGLAVHDIAGIAVLSGIQRSVKQAGGSVEWTMGINFDSLD